MRISLAFLLVLLLTIAFADQNLRTQDPATSTSQQEDSADDARAETDSAIEYEVVDVQLAKPKKQSGRENYIKHAVNSQVAFSYCGNNRLDQGQFCDDGNLIDGDGCSSYCNEEKQSSNAPALVIGVLLAAAALVAGFFVYLKKMRQNPGVKTEGGQTDKEMVFNNKA